MSSINKAIIIGHLGRDPEVRYSASGKAVANITVATSRQWKNKDSGERQEETEWHRIVTHDKLAEIVGQYLKKGSLAYFEGRLKTRKWQDKEGVERYTTEIIADSMQMLGGKSGVEEAQQQARPAAQQGNDYARAKAGSAPRQATSFDDMDSDIPF